MVGTNWQQKELVVLAMRAALLAVFACLMLATLSVADVARHTDLDEDQWMEQADSYPPQVVEWVVEIYRCHLTFARRRLSPRHPWKTKSRLGLKLTGKPG